MIYFNKQRDNPVSMKNIIPWLNGSVYTSPLSPACKMCATGSKLVLLATGLCPGHCFYCPLSFKKGGKDLVYADEWKLDGEDDTQTLIQEARHIDAEGAGITGGDPLVVWKRVKTYIELLKEEFGADFHIHLYTSGLKNTEYIPDLVSSGLDEIRFHPSPSSWLNMEKHPLCDAIKKALDIDVAIEIPALPGMETQMVSLINWANNMGMKWVNLNELEYSERNCEHLNNRGYSVRDDISAAVNGSQEAALQVLDRVAAQDVDVGVHYCSVSFKDGIQLRNRINRRAKNVAQAYEVITPDGTLLKGVIYSSDSSLLELLSLLHTVYDISDKFVFFDRAKKRIEIGLWILERIAAELTEQGYECCMVEEYPTADHLEVERTPLPL